MKPYADYYYQLDAVYQREVDKRAGYEIALDEIITEIDHGLKEGYLTHFYEFIEILSDSDAFWLAIGKGANYEACRHRAISKIAMRELLERINDYDQD